MQSIIDPLCENSESILIPRIYGLWNVKHSQDWVLSFRIKTWKMGEITQKLSLSQGKLVFQPFRRRVTAACMYGGPWIMLFCNWRQLFQWVAESLLSKGCFIVVCLYQGQGWTTGEGFEFQVINITYSLSLRMRSSSGNADWFSKQV